MALSLLFYSINMIMLKNHFIFSGIINAALKKRFLGCKSRRSCG
jgi:hypothetical protein